MRIVKNVCIHFLSVSTFRNWGLVKLSDRIYHFHVLDCLQLVLTSNVFSHVNRGAHDIVVAFVFVAQLPELFLI